MREPEAERVAWERTYRETPYRELPWFRQSPNPFLVRLVRAGSLARGRSIDIGCGAGTVALWLARNGYRALGVDISPTAIAAARRRALRRARPPRFEVASAYALPLGDRRADLATDFGCFHTQPPERRAAYAREVARVLRPNGDYVLVAAAREERRRPGPTHRLSVEEVVKVFEPYFFLVGLEGIASESERPDYPLSYRFHWRRRRGRQPPPFPSGGAGA